MLPPGKTDEVQPVDDGMGRQVKIYMGQFQDTWLENDDNLELWESNRLTASDRRVLIATWFYDAVVKACSGPNAKRKYFEHPHAPANAAPTRCRPGLGRRTSPTSSALSPSTQLPPPPTSARSPASAPRLHLASQH